MTLRGAERSGPAQLNALLASILPRTMVPLAFAVGLPKISDSMAATGVSGKIMVLYLVSLAAETIIAVQGVKARQRDRGPHRCGSTAKGTPEASRGLSTAELNSGQGVAGDGVPG